uniref:Uncharacterized protein n=1 Tax=Anopheles melas TaxID=34690 RepID=A0A182U0D0_9DIPT
MKRTTTPAAAARANAYASVHEHLTWRAPVFGTQPVESGTPKGNRGADERCGQKRHRWLVPIARKVQGCDVSGGFGFVPSAAHHLTIVRSGRASGVEEFAKGKSVSNR